MALAGTEVAQLSRGTDVLGLKGLSEPGRGSVQLEVKYPSRVVCGQP